jgi:hypothetical protein
MNYPFFLIYALLSVLGMIIGQVVSYHTPYRTRGKMGPK